MRHGLTILPPVTLEKLRYLTASQLFGRGPCHGSASCQGDEDEAHLTMRAAGRQFGSKAAELRLASGNPNAADEAAGPASTDIGERIRERASWLSERLRNEGIGPRMVEDLITTWVSAAHQSACERLGEYAH